MQQLESKVKLSGLNLGHIESVLVQRQDNLCLYKRSDDIYEVFYPNKLPEGNVFGKHYPEREGYPSNEDFGRTAWCYTKLEGAVKKFNSELNKGCQ